MPKRFLTTESLSGSPHDILPLPQDIAHHALVVSRLRHGDEIEITSQDQTWLARLIPQGIELLALQTTQAIHEPYIELGTALFKWPRFEWFLEKAVELGADAITPLICERSQIKLDPAAWGAKCARLEKIMREAQRQCLAKKQCHLSPPATLQAYLKKSQTACTFVAMPGNYPRLAQACPPSATQIVLLSGPEGGFSPSEFALIQAHDVKAISLGYHILRAETAPLAMLAVLRCS